MKKLLFLLAMLLLPLVVSAQEFLKIEVAEFEFVCTDDSWFFHKCDKGFRCPTEIILSNGEKLRRFKGHHNRESYQKWFDSHGKICKTDVFNLKEDFSKDKTFIYHTGNVYLLASMNYERTYTIKEITVREVKRENEASLNGNFSLTSFFFLHSKGKISGSMRGGTKSVVNVFFENGGYASIDASDDPIWLEAKAGMKVKLYILRDTKLYELIL